MSGDTIYATELSLALTLEINWPSYECGVRNLVGTCWRSGLPFGRTDRYPTDHRDGRLVLRNWFYHDRMCLTYRWTEILIHRRDGGDNIISATNKQHFHNFREAGGGP